MDYKKLAKPSMYPCLAKCAFAGSFVSLILSCFLIYKITELQQRIDNLEYDNVFLKIHDRQLSNLKEEFNQIKNQSDSFQYDTGLTDLDYEIEDDYTPDYEYSSETEATTEQKLGAGDLIKDRKFRAKREILRRTLDGVPVNSESFEEILKKNKSEIFQPPRATTAKTFARKSLVLTSNEDKSKAFRKVIKKPILKSGGTVGHNEFIHHDQHKRRHRERRFKPAIHLSGDIYDANGWGHHHDNHYKNWSREPWVKSLGMDQHFYFDNGYLKAAEPGLYFVYAQVLYYDEHDTNGYAVYKNEDMILQCTTTSHTSHRVKKSNTCFTAGITYLSEGDRLRVHDIEPYRYSIFKPGKSFFGAIKLSETRTRL